MIAGLLPVVCARRWAVARVWRRPDPPTGTADRGCIVTGEVMPWLADTDVGAAHGFARALFGARTVAELRRRALSGLAELVPADVLMWDRVELATGVVRHEAIPADAEPPGAFAAIVGESAGHPLLSAHAARRRPALRLSEAVEPRRLSHSELYGDLLHPSGVEYAITIGVRAERREMVVAGLGRSERQFSERDRDVLDLVRPVLEAALRDARRARAARPRARHQPAAGHRRRAARPLRRDRALEPRCRALARPSTSGRPSTRAGCPRPVAAWLALPPRPPLVSVRDGRRLTVHLLPGDPHALLLEEEVASFRPDALDRLGLTPRETEVLCAAAAIEEEADIAWELCLSLHAVRDRLAHLEAKLGVHTAADAVTRALRESI